jgi:hypothetical protein
MNDKQKQEFEQYKQGYNDLSKALGKIKIMHQDAKIEEEVKKELGDLYG